MNKHLRMCCVCREHKSKDDLIRFTLDNGEVKLNMPKQVAFGRSAYVCKDPNCIATAIKKRSLNRAFHKEVAQETYETLTKFL